MIMGSSVSFTQMVGYSIALAGLGTSFLFSIHSFRFEADLFSTLPVVFKTPADVLNTHIVRVKTMLGGR